MKKQVIASACSLVLALCLASTAAAVPPEYVKICSLYGSGFNYVPGTDICWNAQTGDTRQQTVGGTWRSLQPYPEGVWSQQFKRECAGKIVKVGDFHSTDFALNPWDRQETAPFDLVLPANQFITKVIMSGGFYDPRVKSQGGSNTGTLAFCLRGKDSTVLIPAPNPGDPPTNAPYGNGLLPIGCISNSRILNMPLPYVISATAAYPQTFSLFPGADETVVAGPFTYGRQLVVTTDIGAGGPNLLTYHDKTNDTYPPLAGTLSVYVCLGGVGFAKP